ncbi:MAG: DUF4743 domain-containing protein [Burkholderiales bacterium]|nr:DUF4743 domain-containing protein [Burkholderiales bacterium]
MSAAFAALDAARLQRTPRVPLRIDGRIVGSVAAAALVALHAWPRWLRVDADGVTLLAPRHERDAAFAQMHRSLRAQGLIRAWRDEAFELPDPASALSLATIERAAARFWGTLTRGAHATGYVADADGRPTHLWIAQRALDKATDPGLFDNLVGGGVPAGQSPHEALVREGFEEAGLTPGEVARARAAGVLLLARDIPEGFQQERLYAFDLELPAGREPHNQDGEVAGFSCLPLAEAVRLAAGNGMTVDAAVVTIDFLCRHRLLRDDDAEAAERVAALRLVDDPFNPRNECR